MTVDPAAKSPRLFPNQKHLDLSDRVSDPGWLNELGPAVGQRRRCKQ